MAGVDRLPERALPKKDRPMAGSNKPIKPIRGISAPVTAPITKPPGKALMLKVELSTLAP